MNFEFFVAQRYLKAKRKGLFAIITTLIGVAGVAVGVAALLTTMSVMNGFQDDIQKKIIGAQSHIMIYGQMSQPVYSALQKKLEKDKEITALAPVIYGQAILTFHGRSLGIVLKGLDAEAGKKVNTLNSSITEGGWTVAKRVGEKEAVPPSIVLGEELAKNLGLWLGDDAVLISPKSMATSIGVFPKMKKFRVSGVIKTGYYEFDNTMGYAAIDAASDFLGLKGAVTGMELRIADLDNVNKVASRVSDAAGFPYVVRTFAQMNQTLYAALKLEKFVMFLILTLIVLVASLNIASNLILLGTEKMRDIGILRAMGATPAKIQSIFWWEGFLIGTTGIVIGLVLGLLLCWTISTFNFVELPADVYYVTKVPVAVKLWDIIAIVVGSYVLCFLATLYPALRCSKVRPVDAIRYG